MNAQTRFIAYRVEESYFKVKPVKENEKFTLAPKFTCSIKSGKEDFSATLTVELGDGVSVAAPAFEAAGIPLTPLPDVLLPHSAVSCGRVALRLAQAGGAVDADSLAPVYLRESQAETTRRFGGK